MKVRYVLIPGVLACALASMPASHAQVLPGETQSAKRTVGIATRFADTVGELADRPGTGLARLKVDDKNRTLHVWWHGEVPQIVEATLAAARIAGVTVNVNEAKFSDEEMTRLSSRFVASPVLAAAGLRVILMTSPPDKSSFDVWYTQSGWKGTALEANSRLRELALSEVGVPIKELHEAPTSSSGLSATRQNDEPSWSGGGMITSTKRADGSRTRCSTGFAVKRLTGTDVSRMLTALHCNREDDDTGGPFGWYDGTQSATTDVSTWDTFSHQNEATVSIPDLDSELLNPVGATQGMVYTCSSSTSYRPLPNDCEGNEPVLGAASNHAGSPVIVSGANTGGNYTIIQDATANTWTCSFFTYCHDGVITRGVELDEVAAGTGDSGGPVVSYPESGPGVYAMGIVSTPVLGTEVPCDYNYTRLIPTTCYSEIVYASINKIIPAYAAAGKPIELRLG